MVEKNKTYTAADFARYHAGTMPPGEMHALEKAALEDPFLEDALEGYKQLLAVENDIEELKARLGEKRKKKSVFFISSFAQNKWWRVAALLIIMAGSGYFFYRLNFRETPLAENDMKSSAGKTDSVVALKSEIEKIKVDTVSQNNNIALERRSAGKIANPASPAPTASLLHETKRQIKKKPVIPEQKMESVAVPGYAMKSKESFSADSSYAKQGNKETDTLAANEYVLKGIVTDDVGAPVPFANITAKASKTGTVADANGRFFLRSKDSSITATAVATGFEAKTFPLKKDMQPTIAMNRNKGELTTVVVTTARAMKGKDLPQPSGGPEKFDQYLKENTSPVYDENNERLTGEVLLSFEINKKGRPKNIRVLRSSCEACEQKAIQLLENGPDWIGKKNKPGTLVIKF